MPKRVRPVPGTYYVNLTGQLIKVRYLLYKDGLLSSLLLEFLDGHRMQVQIDEWYWLDLKPYCDWFLDQRQAEEEIEI